MSTRRPAWGTRAWFEGQLGSGADGAAAYYGHAQNAYQQRRHDAVVAAVAAHVGSAPGSRVLDIGCGLGDLGHRVAAAIGTGSVVGIDFVPSVVAAARVRFSRSAFIAGGVTGLPVRTASMDGVIASEVLYYLTETDRAAAVAEIARVLRPGGWMVVTSASGDARYLTERGLRALMQPQFSVVVAWHDHMRWYRPVLRLCRRAQAVAGRIQGARPHGALARVARSISAGCDRILRWRWLPRALDALGRTLMPRATQSGVGVLCLRSGDPC